MYGLRIVICQTITLLPEEQWDRFQPPPPKKAKHWQNLFFFCFMETNLIQSDLNFAYQWFMQWESSSSGVDVNGLLVKLSVS